MKFKYIIIFLISFLTNCKSTLQHETRYIYYLHGRIIEIQGRNAYSEEFGNYEFDKIVKALEVYNSKVIAEVRTDDVDNKSYASNISGQIDNLVKRGVKPKNITVVGASKGAIIASTISSINANPINYVVMAGNNEYQEQNNDWKFHGNILCFYDESDKIAGKNYDYWKQKSTDAKSFEQIKIKKNLGHGFLYKPYRDWIIPTKKWIIDQKL